MSKITTYFVGLYLNDKVNKFEVILDSDWNIPYMEGPLEDIQIIQKLSEITGFCCKAFTKSFIYDNKTDSLILVVGFKTAFINLKKNYKLYDYVEKLSDVKYEIMRNEVHNVLV